MNGFTKKMYIDKGVIAEIVQYGYFRYTVLCLMLSQLHSRSSPSLLNSKV